MNDDQLRAIIRDVRTTLGPAAPDWADENAHDPGVTIVQLFGFLTESQLVMNRPQREQASRAATRVTERLRYLQQRGPETGFERLVRPHYFTGKLVTAEDLRLEQDYVRGRLRRHNRLFVGAGIVQGLEVAVTPDGNGGATVTVEPGFAIDASGEEIVLAERRQHTVATADASTYVLVRAVDRPAAPVVLSDSLAPSHGQVVEDAAIDAAPQPGSALAIARLLRERTGWRVDPDYQPARLHQAAASSFVTPR